MCILSYKQKASFNPKYALHVFLILIQNKMENVNAELKTLLATVVDPDKDLGR